MRWITYNDFVIIIIIHHPKAAVERVVLPRPMRAVVIADNNYTPLDLQYNIPLTEPQTAEPRNTELLEAWKQKALHGRHPHDLSQENVDYNSVEQLADSWRLVSGNGGFSHSHPRPGDFQRRTIENIYWRRTFHSKRHLQTLHRRSRNNSTYHIRMSSNGSDWLYTQA